MTLQEIGAVLAAFVGVWTASSAVLNGAVVANERRDTLLLGRVKDHDLTYEHKKLILYNDWLPMVIWIALLSMVASLAVIVLPWFLITNERYARSISALGCLIFGLVAISQLFGSLKEFRVMKRALDAAKPVTHPVREDASHLLSQGEKAPQSAAM